MTIKIGRYAVDITHPERIVFPKSGLTKQDLIDYYVNIAPIMMPYIDDRLISMQRFPQGITGEGFFQKDAADYFPEWITRKPIAKENGEKVDYVVIDKPATLIYLANQNCITPHVWLSKADNLNKPDRLIFDLDPEHSLPFSAVQDVAKKLKLILDELELPSFCMLTGAHGAHIVVPLKRVHAFDETRAFAHDIAILLAQQFPKLITTEMHKSKRGKRIFIDWLRNGYGATAAAPYAVRPYEGAPVAMPVTWQELEKKGMISQKYTIKNAMKRLNKVGDVWHDIQKHAVSLKEAKKKLARIKI
jgi:bifunctional non-homologous end joining protein LigD